MKRSPLKKRSQSPQKKLIEKLDRVYSKYRRLFEADDRGFVSCCTCGVVRHWKRVDCGHFHNRRHMGLRWFDPNTGTQCRRCNRFEEGEKERYEKHIIRVYGEEMLDTLALKKRLGKKWSNFELEALVIYYTGEVKRIAQEKGLEV